MAGSHLILLGQNVTPRFLMCSISTNILTVLADFLGSQFNFFEKHRSRPWQHYLAQLCRVVNCNTLSSPGFCTCNNIEHRALENAYFRRAKALFQLREKLKRAGAT